MGGQRPRLQVRPCAEADPQGPTFVRTNDHDNRIEFHPGAGMRIHDDLGISVQTVSRPEVSPVNVRSCSPCGDGACEAELDCDDLQAASVGSLARRS